MPSRPLGTCPGMTETGEQFEDQDSEPTSTTPGDKRPQDQSTGSDAGDPKTNIEAEAAAGGGPEMDPDEAEHS